MCRHTARRAGCLRWKDSVREGEALREGEAPAESISPDAARPKPRPPEKPRPPDPRRRSAILRRARGPVPPHPLAEHVSTTLFLCPNPHFRLLTSDLRLLTSDP